jgi:hypothetical protein
VDGCKPLVGGAARALHQGQAVQVDPMKPKLKPPGTKRLNLKCDILPFNFCFQIQLVPLHQGVGLRVGGHGHTGVPARDQVARRSVGLTPLSMADRLIVLIPVPLLSFVIPSLLFFSFPCIAWPSNCSLMVHVYTLELSSFLAWSLVSVVAELRCLVYELSNVSK